MKSKENIRLKAIEFINELSNPDYPDVHPYKKERGRVGHLLTKLHKLTKHQSQPTLSSQKMNGSVYSTKLPSMTENLTRKRHNSYLDILKVGNIEPYNYEDQIKAKRYKEGQHKRALISMAKKRNSVALNQYQPDAELVNDRFKWKMNMEDKGKNLAYLFYEARSPHHERKLIRIQPEKSQYNPNWEYLQPKSIQVIMGMKRTDKQIYHPFHDLQQYDKVTSQPNGKRVDSLDRMNSQIQNKIHQEVSLSILSQPQSMHPLEDFSLKPFSLKHLDSQREELKHKYKETMSLRRNIQDRIEQINNLLSSEDRI